jgi:aspartate kinase
MVVWDNPKSAELIKVLTDVFYQVTALPVAIVCAMGTNIAMPGFLYRATKALYEKGINVESFAQSLMQVNMQFVINRDHYEEAVIALNEELCHHKASK